MCASRVGKYAEQEQELTCTSLRRAGEYVASRRGGSKPKRDRVPKAQAGPSSSSLRAQSTSVGPDAGQRQPSTSAVAKAQAVDFQATLEPADDPMEGVEDFVAKLQGFMRNLRPGSQPTAVVAADPHDLMADSVSLMSGWKNEDWRVRRFPDGESMCVTILRLADEHAPQD